MQHFPNLLFSSTPQHKTKLCVIYPNGSCSLLGDSPVSQICNCIHGHLAVLQKGNKFRSVGDRHGQFLSLHKAPLAVNSCLAWKQPRQRGSKGSNSVISSLQDTQNSQKVVLFCSREQRWHNSLPHGQCVDPAPSAPAMQPFKNTKPSNQTPRRAFFSFSFTVRHVSSMTLLPVRVGWALPHHPALLSLWLGRSPGEEPLVPCTNHLSLPSSAWFHHSNCSALQQIVTFG